MPIKLLFLINIAVTYSFNISETTQEIKNILNNYRISNRHPRYVANSSMSDFIESHGELFENTERLYEFLKYHDVSDCPSGSGNRSYVKRHIFHGLVISDKVPDSHWCEYKSVFDKNYDSEEDENAALRKWRENLQLVAQHNRQFLLGKQTFSLHLNHFGDLTDDDFTHNVLKLLDTRPLFDPAYDHHKTAYHHRSRGHRRIPRKVDWRDHGFRPIRERQWQCGACYAFAVAHALQAQMYKKHGDWRELSPQQIVDCSTLDGNYGCDGGSLNAAFRYAARAGLLLEKDYPYHGKKGRCRYSPLRVAAKARRWAVLPAGDEAAIERALATIGPLAVAVNASPRTFQLYRFGIYDDPFCTPWTLNHAMLLVGYTPHYWILLNWWGRHWGEDGYMRIRRGFNRCGVASMAAYVEL